MHLLMVSETYPPEVNGVALTVQCLLQNLRASGHRVSLVRPRQSSDAQRTPATGQDEWLTAGLPIPRYPGLRFGLPAGRRLRRLIREQHVDALYVATEGPLGWSAVGAARALRVPVACGFHTRFDDYFGHYGAAFLQRAALAWMRRFHNRASCTLVPTTELKQWLSGQGFARVELLRRAVDTQRFDPRHRDPELRRQLGVAPGAPLVLYVGRLAPEKNLELVSESFERIASMNPSARMLWIGDGPSRASLQQAHPRHLFPGILRGDDLARHFASSDLFLFPSLTETFGNVTLEAMASGVSVCAFDYAAAHEHIQSGVHGELAEFGQSNSFLRSAEKLGRDWLSGKRLGQAGRQAVEHLSPQNVADDFVQLMQSMTGNSGPPPAPQKDRHAALPTPLV